MTTHVNLTLVVIMAATALHREAWRALLSAQFDIVVIGAVGTASEVTSLLRPGRPTTVLVDLPTPEPELASNLKAIAPELGILFLVQSSEMSQILLLLQAGASGCLSRDDMVADLVRGIIAAGRGEIVLPQNIAVRALTDLATGEAPGEGTPETLSEREAEVLRLLAQGFTNKDIAQTLILSVRTVETHLRSIYGKLGVRSRTEAVLWAVRHSYEPTKEVISPMDS